MRILFALALMVLLALPARAQPDLASPAPEDQGLLAACLETRDIDQGRECIGAVSAACREPLGEGADTSYAAMACALREQAAWRALLDAAAANLRARETETQITRLEAALVSGDEWSRARCAYAASIFEGGSLARVVGAVCARNAMAERALDLHNRQREYDENF